jgi:hypothetical protein
MTALNTLTLGASYTVWVADYNVVLPQQGGSFSQPNWSFDFYTSGLGRCSAVLAVPGGHRGDTYFGGTDGRIYRYDPQLGPHDLSDPWTISHGSAIVHGADAYADQGGDSNHGKRFSEIDVFMTSEYNAWRIDVLGGDEWIQNQNQTGDRAQASQDVQFSGDISESRSNDGESSFELRTVHNFKLPSVTGRRAVVRLQIRIEAGDETYGYHEAPAWEYNGYQIYWMPGVTFRKLIDVEL